MRQLPLVVWVVASAVVLPLPASAQIEMPQHVVGSGGGEMSGESHMVQGTLGQVVVGVATGPSHIHEIGFWYGPDWFLTEVSDGQSAGLLEYRLGQNYPNPFNPVTTVGFSVPERCWVSIKLYSAEGREVRTLVDQALDPGRHTRVLDGEGLASGIYFCRMTAGRFVEARKLVLLR